MVAELEAKKNQASILRVIVRLSEKLGNVKELMRIGDVVEAAKLVRVLKKALRIGGVDEERENEEVVVYGLLRKQWLLCFEEVNEFFFIFLCFLGFWLLGFVMIGFVIDEIAFGFVDSRFAC